jgi:hypothetical protein
LSMFTACNHSAEPGCRYLQRATIQLSQVVDIYSVQPFS